MCVYKSPIVLKAISAKVPHPWGKLDIYVFTRIAISAKIPPSWGKPNIYIFTRIAISVKIPLPCLAGWAQHHTPRKE